MIKAAFNRRSNSPNTPTKQLQRRGSFLTQQKRSRAEIFAARRALERGNFLFMQNLFTKTENPSSAVQYLPASHKFCLQFKKKKSLNLNNTFLNNKNKAEAFELYELACKKERTVRAFESQNYFQN
jgi:hypothetical protein